MRFALLKIGSSVLAFVAVSFLACQAQALTCSGGTNDGASCVIDDDCPDGMCAYVILEGRGPGIVPGKKSAMRVLATTLDLDRDGIVQAVPLDKGRIKLQVDELPTYGYYRFLLTGKIKFGELSVSGYALHGAKLQLTGGEGTYDPSTNEIVGRITFVIRLRFPMVGTVLVPGSGFASGHVSAGVPDDRSTRIQLRMDGGVTIDAAELP